MLKIKELRIEKGIEQQELAKIIQIGKGSISNWELGRTEPSIEYIVKLADYFEVSTDYLLGRSNDVGVIETNANLTSDQQELLSLYSKMSFQDKNQLIGFAKALVY